MINKLGDWHVVLNQVVVVQALCELFMTLFAHVLVNYGAISYYPTPRYWGYTQLFGLSLLTWVTWLIHHLLNLIKFCMLLDFSNSGLLSFPLLNQWWILALNWRSIWRFFFLLAIAHDSVQGLVHRHWIDLRSYLIGTIELRLCFMYFRGKPCLILIVFFNCFEF